MGVPSYFKNIIQRYNNILIKNDLFNKKINNLFFDLLDKFFTILILGYQKNKEPAKAGSLK